MHRCLTLSLVLAALLAAPAGWADVTFQCPAPDSIRQITIPHSVNCAYSAESDGVAFGGYNGCGLAGLPFVGAQASEVNGYWSLYCSYSNGAAGNVMSVGPSPVIETCHFEGGDRACRGSLAECAVTCAAKPSSSAVAEPEEKTVMSQHARGTFEVKVAPIPEEGSFGAAGLGRMSIDKTFHGDLEGASVGQMLTAMSTVEGSGAYVAVEKITGRLAGRTGSFMLHHRGVMTRGEPSLSVTIVPDSGTGELAGIAGTLGIDIRDGQHFYDLEYTLGAEP
jgi:hypothetical protein